MADTTNPIASNLADTTAQTNNNDNNPTPNTALEWEIILPNISLDNAKATEPIILPDVSVQNTQEEPMQEELIAIPKEEATTPSEQVNTTLEPVSIENTPIITDSVPVSMVEATASTDGTTQTSTAAVSNTEAPRQESDIVPTENVLDKQNTGNDDPFDGLNIVFNKPTPPQTPVAAENVPSDTTATAQVPSESKAFVDPFLNSDIKSQETSTTTQVSLDTIEASTQDTTNTSTTNLDSLLTTINTPPVATVSSDGLTSKKKRILVAASGLVGVTVLVAASYLVFTTMYPQETDNLAKNLQGNVAGTDTTATPTEQPAQVDTNTSTPEPTPSEQPKQEPEEELPTPTPDPVDTSANQFGQDDELPNTAPGDNTTATTTPAQEKPADQEETTPTDIAPEITDALKTIEGYVDKCKQLLALAKEKNDTTSIRAIAGVLKSVKEIQRKIDEKTYTTYSADIEKPLSELNFNLDQITAKLISK